MSLGPVEGVPLIGRPFDVSIRVLLDPGTDTASLCARAEVLQGEVQTSGVTARIEAISGQQAVLRVRTSRPVDEPVVTVVAHVGCLMPATRRFVLLSELPAELLPLPFQLSTSLAPPVAASPRGRASRLTDATGTRSGRRSRAAPGEQGSVPSIVRLPSRAPLLMQPQQQPRAPATAAPPRSVVLKPPVAKAGPANRLRLDPLDLVMEAEPALKLTHRIDRIGEATPAQRAQAAVEWRALNTPPAELQRLLTMESELKSMRQQMQASKAEVAGMRAQLQQSEEGRRRAAWGLSAIALAFLGLLIAALFWRRREVFAKRRPAWWRDSAFGPEAEAEAARAERAMDETQVVARQAPAQESMLDLDLSAQRDETVSGSSAAYLSSTPVSAFSHLDFQGSQPASWRSLKSEELHDIQEQADFFVSLGDYDRAVNVLMSHVQASPQTSALAWMALLDLHHRLKRKQGYEGLRDQIQRRMNVIVPSFDDYRQQSAGLEDYAEAMDRIKALWPQSRVLDVIEEFIYRMPGAAIIQPFELAAFHELLLLYNIGKSIVDEYDVQDIGIDELPDIGDDFPMTNLAPLSADLQGPSEQDVLLFSTLLAGGRVDVDLNGPQEAQAAKDQEDAKGVVATQGGNLIDFDDFDAATSRIGSRQKSNPR